MLLRFPSKQHSLLVVLVLALCATPVSARGIYQQPSEFIDSVLGQDLNTPKLLWLSRELQATIKQILGHTYPALRLRYWRHMQTTAWVLEEVGKEKSITLGVVVEANEIVQLRVLAFRESRGGEIRYAFFTDQFHGLSLDNNLKLDGHIDGISGATLSVRATKKVARLALFLHQQVTAAP